MNEPIESSPAPEQPAQEPSTESMPAPARPKWFNPILVKAALVAAIFGLLMIPLTMIQGTIEERQTYNVDYPEEYRGPGAGQQTIVGPVLSIPYEYQVIEEKQITPEDVQANSKSNKKAPVKTVKFARTELGVVHFFPENLNVKGTLVPEIRDGGKFKNIIYNTALEFSGKFDTSDLARKKIKDSDVMWEDAFVTVGVSDLRGIRKETTLSLAGKQYKFVPGTNGFNLVNAGQSALVKDIANAGSYPFSFTLNFNGSRSLNIFPAGKENKIQLSSSWKSPSFEGGYLPTKRSSVPGKGFTAEWEVSYFTRNFPQLWTDRDPDLSNSLAQYMVGVKLATPVEFYRTTIRAVKYGCMFIVMPFLVFFIFEMVTKVRIHEMQYLLVGLALSLFFLVLIAVSEYIPFVWAYDIASFATIAQITWYTHAFSKERSASLWKIMGVVLGSLYSYLYILLQLEDMSLLFGAIGLFIALTIVLYTTRNINWYNYLGTADSKQPA